MSNLSVGADGGGYTNCVPIKMDTLSGRCRFDRLADQTLRFRVAMASSIVEPPSNAEQVANHPFICISIWDFNASPCRRRNTLNPWTMNATGA